MNVFIHRTQRDSVICKTHRVNVIRLAHRDSVILKTHRESVIRRTHRDSVLIRRAGVNHNVYSISVVLWLLFDKCPETT